MSRSGGEKISTSAHMIDFDLARQRGQNKNNSWKKSKDRLLDEVWPAMNPSFRLHAGDRVFTIGSCFARNIEHHLQKLGFDIPMLAFTVPPEEAGGQALLNKYTPAQIFQEIDWARAIFVRGGEIAEADSLKFLYECQDGLCIDTCLHGFVPVTRERFFQRRSQIYDVFKAMFSSDCVVITLGLIEAWFDRENGVHIHECPRGKHFARNRSRFGFETLNYPQCREFIQKSIDIIKQLNPKAKFLITTSPVPLSRTFTDEDVIIANMQSKSVLRAVAGDIAAANEQVDYFPSYESAALTKSWAIWRDDLTHVSDAFVGKIVARLVETYCADIDEGRKLFQQSYVDFKDDAPEKALEFARQAVEKSADDADLLRHLGDVLARQGDLKEAEAQFARGIALRPRDAALHYCLSEVLARQGRLEESIAAAYRCLALAPDSEKFHRHVGRLWMRKRKMGKAVIQLALAAAHRRLRRTKRSQLKKFIRVSLPFLQKMGRLTYSST